MDCKAIGNTYSCGVKVGNVRVLVMREGVCVKAYQDDVVVVNWDFFLC